MHTNITLRQDPWLWHGRIGGLETHNVEFLLFIDLLIWSAVKRIEIIRNIKLKIELGTGQS